MPINVVLFLGDSFSYHPDNKNVSIIELIADIEKDPEGLRNNHLTRHK